MKEDFSEFKMLLLGMSALNQQKRSASQFTLGNLIEYYQSIPSHVLVQSIRNPHSYRGYYEDLSFEFTGEVSTPQENLAICKGAMGEVYQGYKGGDFQMGKLTPVWIAYEGDCGKRIMGFLESGDMRLEEENDV